MTQHDQTTAADGISREQWESQDDGLGEQVVEKFWALTKGDNDVSQKLVSLYPVQPIWPDIVKGYFWNTLEHKKKIHWFWTNLI